MRFTALLPLLLVLPACSSREATSGANAPARPHGASAIVAQLEHLPELAPHLGRGRTLIESGASYRLGLAASGALVSALPRTASGVLRVSAALDADAWVEVTALGIADVEGKVVEGALVAEEARPSTDVLWVADANEAEELRVLRDASAPTTARYAMRFGSAIRSARAREGRIELLDAAGKVVLSTAPMFAVDAAGVHRDLDVSIDRDGTTLVASLDPRGLAYPIVVDPTWTATPSMTVARLAHTATVLTSGKVLVVGGGGAKADLYDPATNTWSSGGTLSTNRFRATATLMTDGRVLVAGGDNGNSTTDYASAELYDPVANTWSAAAPMSAQREQAAAIVLQGQAKVLVTGGGTGSGATLTAVASTEIYDPATNTWTAGLAMTGPRREHQITDLGNGNGTFLISGGTGGVSTGPLSTAETYNTGLGGKVAPAMSVAHSSHAAVLLPNKKKVLIFGGFSFGGALTSVAELYDVATGTFSTTGSMNAARVFCAGVKLSNSGVLAAGGQGPLSTAEIYDSNVGTWVATTPMTSARSDSAAVALGTTSVLVTGGAIGTSSLSSAELYSFTANGAACASSPECVSGFCIDGVCCDTACKGQCSACNLTGTVGVCSPVDGAAPVTPRAACPAPGKLCVAGACSNTCKTTGDCATGSFCDAGTCTGVAANGAACTASEQCSSGFCVDGACCESACAGQCQACDVTGSAGQCVAILGAPHGARPACSTKSGSPCASTLCDGVDITKCAAFVGPDVSCRAASCATAVSTLPASCDGKGNCPSAVTASCGAYACDGTTNGCKTTCATASDCATGFDCNAGACKPAASAHCSSDGLSSVSQSGLTTACGLYRCRSDGTCGTNCSTTDDCAPSDSCDTTGVCVAPPSNSGSGSSGGCAISSEASTTSMLLPIAIGLVGVAIRRRRRAPRAGRSTTR